MTTQFRLYIGPVYLAAGTPEHYDWSALNEGAASTLTTATTLAATLNDGATSMTIASATGWGTSGGFWVAGNGTGQGWEYVRFSARSGTTVSGLVREASADRDHNGVHSSGAAVRLWWQVASDNGTLHLVEQMDDNLSALSWYAEIGGINLPKTALKNKHVCVVQTRDNFAGSWTNLLVGFLDSPSVRDDAQRSSPWQVRIQSIAWLLSKTWLTGVRVGDLDLAKYAVAASSSQTLVDVYAERTSGDFVASDPSFEASNVQNATPGVLWMAERVHGTANTPTAGFRFTNVYLNPPPGSRAGTRFIELTAGDATTLSGMSIYSAIGGGSMAEWYWNGPGDVEAGDKIVLCEDAQVYEDAHPLSEHVYIRADYGFFTMVIAANGTLACRLPAWDAWYNIIKWGDGRGGLSTIDTNPPPTWSGAGLTPPAYGQTMRYNYVTSAYEVGYIQTAGYTISDSPAEWLMLTLPPLGLTLRDDISSSVPAGGALLPIIDKASASTTGLPASGTIQIGNEQITYSAKSKYGVTVSARGAGGTTAAAHKSGDVIQIVDGGVATQAHLIKRIGWKRSGGTSYLKDYRIKVSKLEDVRTPDDPAYNADWSEIYNTSSGSASSYTQTLSPAQRIRSILFQIEEMTVNNTRPRLNEVNAEVDAAVWEAGTTLAAGTLAGAVAQQLASNAGLPAGAFSTAGGSLAMQGFTTANEDAWSVLSDLADFARLRLYVQRDSKLRTELDPFWTAGSFTATETWTRDDAKAVEYAFAANENVSQVELHWRNADESSTGVVRYPSPPWGDGKVLVIDNAIFADGSAAQSAAGRLFFMRRFPYTLLVEMAGGNPALRAGAIHALTWQFDPTQPASTRIFLVQSVDHTLDRMEWATVLNLIEIERTSAA